MSEKNVCGRSGNAIQAYFCWAQMDGDLEVCIGVAIYHSDGELIIFGRVQHESPI